MDLQTAVAASMLPRSRSTVAAAFKHLRHDSGAGAPFLEFLWAATSRGEVLDPALVAETLESAVRAVEDGARRGIEPIPLFDPRYPPLLACTGDPPPVLWARGCLEVLTRPAVAVVGSRAASPYALQVGARLGAELAERGVLVASGLARGVDSAAHRGCIKAGGSTVAVLGSGLDRVYPPEHDQLAAEIAAKRPLAGRAGGGGGTAAGEFPAAQPDHQRDLARDGGRRSLGKERFADHRPLRLGTGSGRDGCSRQCAVRAQPRLACPPEGRRQGRRDSGRYPPGAGLELSGGFSCSGEVTTVRAVTRSDGARRGVRARSTRLGDRDSRPAAACAACRARAGGIHFGLRRSIPPPAVTGRGDSAKGIVPGLLSLDRGGRPGRKVMQRHGFDNKLTCNMRRVPARPAARAGHVLISSCQRST